ncbi:MAG TPA: type IV toxin-antitoxin system AbiEi family antitoxin domain-containing protein [Streptosporangiaceae bacterium]
MPPETPPACRQLIRRQAGVITRRQALATGLPATTVETWVQHGRWTRLDRGIYATGSGPSSRRALLWAALLRAGPGAVLSHETAAELGGLISEPTAAIHVMVPARRNPARGGAMPGIVVHRSALAGRTVSRNTGLPRTGIDDTVIDLTQTSATASEAFTWLGRAVALQLTTARRLRRAATTRTRLHWRAEIGRALTALARGDPPGLGAGAAPPPVEGTRAVGCRPVRAM